MAAPPHPENCWEVLRFGVREEALVERIREATGRGCPLGQRSLCGAHRASARARSAPTPPNRPPRPQLWHSRKRCNLVLSPFFRFSVFPFFPFFPFFLPPVFCPVAS